MLRVVLDVYGLSALTRSVVSGLCGVSLVSPIVAYNKAE